MQETHAKTVLGMSPYSGHLTFRSLLVGKGKALSIGLVFLVLSNLVVIILPRFVNACVSLIETGKPVNILLFGMGQVRATYLWPILLFMTGLAILYIFLRTFSRTYIFNIGRAVERDLRQILFGHLSTLSSNFYAKYSVGDLMSHATNDIGNVRLAAGFALLNALNIIVVLFGTLPILFAMNAVVALAVLAPFPLVMIVAKLVSKRMFKATQGYQSALSDMTTHLQEALSGISLIKAYHREKKENERFAHVNHDLFMNSRKVAKVRVIMFPLTRAMAGLGVVMALFVGGQAVVNGTLSVGDFVEVNLRLMALAWPAISLGFIVSIMQRGKASLMRIDELLQAQPDIVDGNTTLEKIESIELKPKNYEQGGRKLKEVGFQLAPRKTLGVVGPSGSGKSTLINLLSRNLKTLPNQLFINGVDVSDYNLTSFTNAVSVVPQEPIIFSASLKENIAFRNPNVTDEVVNDLIERVGLTGDVLRLPQGINTQVGERGVLLSGGQRQRVALARALFAAPQLIILDDALSAVDVETEQKIISSLLGMNDSPMLVIVSHRLSVIKRCHEILVLDDGEVVERGKHKELLAAAGLYSALWGKEKLQEAVGGVQ